ncbi:MAG: hypothetical protein ACP5D7_24815 [Limnospira sp.]
MSNCPCCSTPLLPHIRHGKVHWFCPSCWQDMPNFSTLQQAIADAHHRQKRAALPDISDFTLKSDPVELEV